ncbi:hypothetical protein AHAS_Ahas19G0154100 [Arachis hypogaea]
MSVVAYTSKFEELCRFSRVCQGAPEGYEEWKCMKYQNGLRDDIMQAMAPLEVSSAKLVNKSRVVEECSRKIDMARSDRQKSHERDQNKGFVPRGLDFKRSGHPLQPFQGQNNYRRNDNHSKNGKGKQAKATSNDLRCQRCGRYHPDQPC